MITQTEKENMNKFFSYLAYKDLLRAEIEERLERELNAISPMFRVIDERVDEFPYE